MNCSLVCIALKELLTGFLCMPQRGRYMTRVGFPTFTVKQNATDDFRDLLLSMTIGMIYLIGIQRQEVEHQLLIEN